MMDATEFADWCWSLTDEAKRALADRVRAVRQGTDQSHLSEARAAAELIVTQSSFDPSVANVAAAPEGAPVEHVDMAAWNHDVGSTLMEAYTDTLLAIGAGTAIGKGHRRVLAEPLLHEVPSLLVSTPAEVRRQLDHRLMDCALVLMLKVIRDVQTAVLPDDAEETGEEHDWQRFGQRLAEAGVAVTPDELRALPYRVILSDRLRARLGESQH